MEFDWTDEERAFRERVRRVADENADPGWTHHNRESLSPEDQEHCKEFCQVLAEEGLLTPQWPAEYGGRDASGWEQIILSEEMWGTGEPRGPQYMNVNWIAPAIMAAGSDEQKKYHLGRIAKGDVLWCQGFSEPDAGSDLASLKTAGVRDGDVYVVNGQKLWTSYAHAAEFCFLLVRTDPSAEAHAGISILLVPMDLDGIEVREVRSPFQLPHLCHEVFFTDVHVPADCLLGEENRGWEVVRSTLANERVGVARHAFALTTMDTVTNLVTERDGELTASQEATAGTVYASIEAARSLNYAAIQERDSGGASRRSAAYVARAAVGFMEPEVMSASQSMLGLDAMRPESPASWQVVNGTLAPIVAGSLEIQLNLIARIALQLPKEPSAR